MRPFTRLFWITCLIFPLLLTSRLETSPQTHSQEINDQIMSCLSPEFNPEQKTILVNSQPERVISSHLQPWKYGSGSVLFLVISSKNPQARFISFNETYPDIDMTGTWTLYLIGKLNERWHQQAKAQAGIQFSSRQDAGLYAMHGVFLDLAPYFVTENQCLIGVRIQTTYHVQYNEQLILHMIDGQNLSPVFDESMNSSDRYRTYSSYINISKDKINGYFRLHKRTKSIPILDDDPRAEFWMKPPRCYTWNPNSRMFIEEKK